jgi:UDP-N-acetylmuramate-alanine ligase
MSSDDIAQRMTPDPTRAAGWDDTARMVSSITQPGDVLLIMGAGDIHQTALALAADTAGGAA